MFKTDKEILIAIFLGFLLLTSFAIVIIWVIFSYKKRQQKHFLEIAAMNEEFKKQLMQSQIEVQEATFSTVSKELHDNIGQLLGSTKMLIGITERNLPHPPDTLLTADQTLGKAIQELRSLSKMLDKEWLEQFNFIDNLTTEANRINASGDLHVYFSHPSLLPIKAEQQTILFRIVQEAIQNAIKHAQAKTIHIGISDAISSLIITITDDGLGFKTGSNSPNGVGIRNIKHRTHLLGGTIQWQSSAGTGTTITIQLPVHSNTE